MPARARMFAAYNAWANARLYSAAAALSDAQYREDRGAFFKSVHGTLNHILTGDRIWMKRFTGQGEHPDRLDAILFEGFEELREARLAEDARIQAFAASLTPERLAGSFRYETIETPKQKIELLLSPALDHFFNHQTHHRGQAHSLLTQLTGSAPSLDLMHYLRETGLGARILES